MKKIAICVLCSLTVMSGCKGFKTQGSDNDTDTLSPTLSVDADTIECADEEAELPVFTVTTEEQFLDALGSNRVVFLDKDVHLNLSRVLEDESYFKDKPGRYWANEVEYYIKDTPMAVSEIEFDGRQLALVGYENLTIQGAEDASIEVDPRYSYCLYLVGCSGCVIDNLTIGHSEGGYCSGGVIGVKGGFSNYVKNCDLYGCGTYGFDVMDTELLNVDRTIVRDCTYGIMQLRRSRTIRFNACDFFRNREFELIESRGCSDVGFYNCRFFANDGDAPLFSFDDDFTLSGCAVYHPSKNLGTIDLAEQSPNESSFHEDPFDTSIENREIGPSYSEE